MVIIASLNLYANATDSMEDSIEALHELMHFFYSKLTPIYGIVRDVQKYIFPLRCRKSAKAWNKKRDTAAQAVNRVVHLINMLLKNNFKF